MPELRPVKTGMGEEAASRMIRTAVSSTTVISIGYEKNSALLEVEFTSGAVYRYFSVSEHIYRELLSAASVGKTMGEVVIGKYSYMRVR